MEFAVRVSEQSEDAELRKLAQMVALDCVGGDVQKEPDSGGELKGMVYDLRLLVSEKRSRRANAVLAGEQGIRNMEAELRLLLHPSNPLPVSSVAATVLPGLA